MREISWSELSRDDQAARPVALTVGVFDGIHRGHRALIERVTRHRSADSVVVTFRRHPAEVLSADRFPGFIMSLPQKRSTLADLGVKTVVFIDFSTEFSRLTGTEFMDRLLECFPLRYVALGHDFHFGHRVDTDAPAARTYLEARGVAVEVIDAIRDKGELVSSTRVRRLIQQGDLEGARRLLGWSFTLDMTKESVTRAGEWATVGFEDGALPASRQLLPGAGEYEAEFLTDHAAANGALFVGENSLRWQLPDSAGIRYIVLRKRRK